MSAGPHAPLRPIERWYKATEEVDFAERDRLLARARELGPGHRDAAEILAAFTEEQARIAAELARWRTERAAFTAGGAGSSPQSAPKASGG